MFDLEKPERTLNKDFIDKINFRHFNFVDQDTGTVRTESGFDFLLAANNKAVFIEGKKNNRKLSTYQKNTALRVEKSKGLYFVLRYKAGFMDNVCLMDHEEFFKVEGTENILRHLKSCLYKI